MPPRRRHKAILPVVETAASTIYVGGKGGSGGTGKGRGKGAGDHRPLCVHGANCKNFGTLTGCSSLHTDKDRAEMQHKLGDKFVNRDTRMRVFARAAMPVPPCKRRISRQPCSHLSPRLHSSRHSKVHAMETILL